jgi:hypothetical protein
MEYVEKIITIILAIVGWVVAHRFTFSRDLQNKRRETILNHDVGVERVLVGSHTIIARLHSLSIAVGFGGYLFKSRRLRDGIEREARKMFRHCGRWQDEL